MYLKLISLMIMLLTLFGCNENVSDIVSFDSAKSKWLKSTQSKSDYEYTINYSCGACTNQFAVVTVKNGSVISAYEQSSGEYYSAELLETVPSIDDLFKIIEGAIGSASELTVSYDNRIGYPDDIYVDYVKLIADDEYTYRVLSLQ